MFKRVDYFDYAVKKDAKKYIGVIFLKLYHQFIIWCCEESHMSRSNLGRIGINNIFDWVHCRLATSFLWPESCMGLLSIANSEFTQTQNHRSWYINTLSSLLSHISSTTWLSQHQSLLFQWVNSSHRWLEMRFNFSASFFQEIPGVLLSRWVQFGSLTMEFPGIFSSTTVLSINSSVLSLYGPALIHTHDYQRNHSFD